MLLHQIAFRFVPAATVRALPITIHSLLDHQDLIGRSSGYIKGLSDDVQKSIQGLKGVDTEYLASSSRRRVSTSRPRCVLTCNRITRRRLKLPLFIVSSPLFSRERSTQPSTRRAATIAGQQKPTDANITKGVEVIKEVRDHAFSHLVAS